MQNFFLVEEWLFFNKMYTDILLGTIFMKESSNIKNVGPYVRFVKGPYFVFFRRRSMVEVVTDFTLFPSWLRKIMFYSQDCPKNKKQLENAFKKS